VLIGLLLAISACSAAGDGSPSASGQPSPSQPAVDFANRTPSPECFNPPPEVRAVIQQTDPLACYGGTDLTFEGRVVGPGVIDCPGILQPAWFRCDRWVAIEPLPGTARHGIVLAATSGTTNPSMFATLHPDTALSSIDLMDRSLRITGHYDDPAAQTCRYDPWMPPDEPPSPEDTIRSCRNTFVITAVEAI
jgi:hypothetical protein